MIQELTEAIESIFDLRDDNKFNIAIGFFQKYNTNAEADTTGKRFCDAKLHYKSQDESKDISVLGIPLMYIGSKNHIIDFELTSGDELLIFFSDRSLEQWKTAAGTSPQKLSNPVKDSVNHAMAIPVCSVHNANLVSDTPVDSNAIGLRAKPGKKIEIGDGTNEVIDLFDQFLTEMKTLVSNSILGGANSVDAVGSSSTGTLSLIVSQLASVESNITAIQTALANIKV
jgi:hypothetical protein